MRGLNFARGAAFMNADRTLAVLPAPLSGLAIPLFLIALIAAYIGAAQPRFPSSTVDLAGLYS